MGFSGLTPFSPPPPGKKIKEFIGKTPLGANFCVSRRFVVRPVEENGHGRGGVTPRHADPPGRPRARSGTVNDGVYEYRASSTAPGASSWWERAKRRGGPAVGSAALRLVVGTPQHEHGAAAATATATATAVVSGLF